jgi:polyprenyl P-hydroxybenzoate/phenylacrylic acid decarboxylase-like protein
MKLIVAICGASGVLYGIELLKALKELDIESHLIISKWGIRIIENETPYTEASVRALASYSYGYRQMDARIASSSFLVDGMIICPATSATVSKIAIGGADNLIARSADNMLRMRKPLVVAVRESPLSPPCLRNLCELSSAGATIAPLAPAFYHKPKHIEDLIAFMVGKILDFFGIANNKYTRWK